MRVSNGMMANNIQLYLSKHTETLLNIQEQIASGKRINRPSDDPVGMGQALGYKKTIAGLDQYNANITDAKQHIGTVEEILGGVTDLLEEAKDISADLHPDMRVMMADQISVIRDQVLQLANSKSHGFHVFAGHLTDAQPFDSTTGVYSGDSGTKNYIIGEGLQLDLEADGSQIFETAGQSVFDVLSDLENELRLGNAADAQVIAAQLPLLNDALETINSVRAVNAGNHQRLDATEKHNEVFKVNFQELLSRTEDTNVVEAAINLQVQQTAYESTLATAAQIVRPSLIDYM